MKNPDAYEKDDRNRGEINFKPLNLPSISVPAGKLRPFTFEHFVIAMNGMKDDFLMPYIDYAIGIYCNIRKITISQRDRDKRTDIFTEAWEIALNAVYIAATKMSGFDPDKGQFKSYLSKSIHSALVDLLKADGYGDFFDQTSKKKNKDDEPEKHIRIDADCYWRTNTESESNPDDTENEREKRIQKHKNDALEVVIKYIDSLPEIQRAAIYASATGKILRPDLENYGRDYSEILAEKYNTTAAYIRKIAAEGKKKALEEARKQGFNEGSMRSVSMEFLQVKSDTSDTFNKVISAIDQLEPCQQFMLLRHLANSVEADDKKEDTPSVVCEVSQNQCSDTLSDYEKGKQAALESFSELTRRINDAEQKLEIARVGKDLITFVYWFVLIHEYRYMLNAILMPDELHMIYDDIERFTPEEYLVHKRRQGYVRLPDYRTVYGRGYNLPDIIGCALANRCEEEILTFVPDTDDILVCGGRLKRQNLMLQFLQTGIGKEQTDFCDACGKNLNDQPYPYSFRCGKCGRTFNLCEECSKDRIHKNWGPVGREPFDKYEDAINQEMFQGE